MGDRSIQEAVSFEQLQELIREGVVLVDYGAPWCPPCRVLLPILEELSASQAGQSRIVSVNCDNLPDAASAAGVMGMPTVVVYKDGEPMDKLVGLRPISAYQQAIARQL